MVQFVLDLRSDTLSQPSDEMRKAMCAASVGDAFYDEDPTVTQLEKHIAEIFGHESALFVPSGTMSNQIAVQLHCSAGDGLLSAPDLHVVRVESGALAALAGVQPAAAPVEDGFLPQLDLLDEHFVPHDSIVSPPTRMLVAENTHLFSGGRIHPFSHLQALSEWCNERKVAFHCDGARIWHAHVETGIALSAYGSLFKTLSVCFSKGLGAPVGSCLIGPRHMIQKAKIIRKRMGGSMRQCGILAAAAHYALTHHLQPLRDDHRNAKKLATWLRNKYPQARVAEPETNIVLLKFNSPAAEIQRELESVYGLRLSALNSRTLRAVCYRDITSAQINSTIV
ncbi:MAG: hypothetical protein RLZZ488_2799 [Pseudomonadota bacterium]|jgi:threonine aldolase